MRDYKTTSISTRHLDQNDIPLIVSAFAQIGWDKPDSLYQGYLEEQKKGERCVWISFKDNDFAGYVTLKSMLFKNKRDFP